MVVRASQSFQGIPTHDFLITNSEGEKGSNGTKEQQQLMYGHHSLRASTIATVPALQEETARVSTSFQKTLISPRNPQAEDALTDETLRTRSSCTECSTYFLQEKGISYFDNGASASLGLPDLENPLVHLENHTTSGFTSDVATPSMSSASTATTPFQTTRTYLFLVPISYNAQAAQPVSTSTPNCSSPKFQPVQTLLTDPQSIEDYYLALLQDGMNYFEKEDFKTAIEFFRRSFDAGSLSSENKICDDVNAHLNSFLKTSFEKIGQIEHALAALKMGLTFQKATEETFVKLHKAFGEYFMQRDQFQSAIDALQNVLIFNCSPEETIAAEAILAKLYGSLGECFLQRSEIHWAMEAFEKALKFNQGPEESRAQWCLNLGTFYMMKGQSSLAIEKFIYGTQFRSVYPATKIDLLMKLGTLLQAAGRYQEAKIAFIDAGMQVGASEEKRTLALTRVAEIQVIEASTALSFANDLQTSKNTKDKLAELLNTLGLFQKQMLPQMVLPKLNFIPSDVVIDTRKRKRQRPTPT